MPFRKYELKKIKQKDRLEDRYPIIIFKNDYVGHLIFE